MEKTIIIDLVSKRNGDLVVVKSFSIDPTNIDRFQVRIDDEVEKFVGNRLRKLAKRILESQLRES